MITPDTGATALGVTAAYVFWKWLRRPGWVLALGAGDGAGTGAADEDDLDTSCSHCGRRCWLVWRLPAWRATSKRAWGGQCLQLGATLLLGLYRAQHGLRLRGDAASGWAATGS